MNDRRITSTAIFAATVLCVIAHVPTPLLAGPGYGYKKSEDPLVLGVKRVIFYARKAEWPAAHKEFTRLGWQFEEFKKDLDIDIAPRFEAAIRSESIRALSDEIARVMYYALVQKFHWNRKERCKKYVPAKSRVEAALFYYEQILSIGVRDYDRKSEGDWHPKILEDFAVLRKSIGTAGLFGIGARPPEIKAFETESEAILERLRRVYPHVEPPKGKPSGRSTTPGERKHDG